MIKSYILPIIFSISFSSILFSQTSENNINLSLEEVITLAIDSSMDVFIAQNNLLIEYWIYKNYKAGKLPFLDLNSTVGNLNRSYNQEYSFTDSSYHYIDQATFSSYANLSLSQNITKTGGKIFLDSDISRLQNLKENQTTQYTSTIIRIGIEQQLFAFNEFKWDDLTNPILFEKAKKDYLESIENISLTAIDHFFSLSIAQLEYENAIKSKADADTLLGIGEKRYRIASISKEDILSLELEQINSNTNLKKTEQNLLRVQLKLNSFLRLAENIKINLEKPKKLLDLYIDPAQSLVLSINNNPIYLNHKTQLIEAKENISKTKANSRFSAKLTASYGLTQTSDDILSAYQSPTDQEKIALTLQIPILDWGLAKGKYNLAIRQKKALVLQLEQEESDFRQNVLLSTAEFNIKKDFVIAASQVDSIAQLVYNISKKRFLAGQLDLLKLNAAQNASISAKLKYINELRDYWFQYYTIRKLTLYDFEKNKSLSQDFDELIGIMD